MTDPTGRKELGLSDAAFVGDVGRVRALVAAGANVDEDPPGTSPLMEALQEPPEGFDDDAEEIVRTLLQAGARVDAHVAETGRTPIHEAVRPGVRAVRLLLASGADPNAATFKGTTPLHETVQFAAVEVAKELLDAGADPSRKNSDGLTAADLAAQEATLNPYDEDAAELVVLLESRAAP